MANNISITEGTGKTIATDEVGSIHYQLVKLVSGEEGSEARIHGDATNGLLVNLGSNNDVGLNAGTNNIGDVDILTIAAGDNNIGNVDIVSLPATPAGTNLIGRISASRETSTIYNGTTALTPKYAVIDDATSGDNELVAAVANKKIRVISLMLMAAGTVNGRFESSTAGNFLSGEINLVANVGFALGANEFGWFETVSGESLNLQLSAAISVDGFLTYIEV